MRERTFSAVPPILLRGGADPRSILILKPVLAEGPRKDIAEVIRTIMSLLDKPTITHSEGVKEISVQIAERFRLPADQVEKVKFAALLHDVGKIAFPKELENKRWCEMSPAEKRIIRRHPTIGAAIVARMFNGPGREEIIKYILHHHERWNGSGYPSKLRGKATPFGARIIGVVDAYDALRRERPYRQWKMTKNDALKYVMWNAPDYEEIKRGLPAHLFDADVVGKLVEVVDSRFIAKTMAKDLGGTLSAQPLKESLQ